MGVALHMGMVSCNIRQIMMGVVSCTYQKNNGSTNVGIIFLR